MHAHPIAWFDNHQLCRCNWQPPRAHAAQANLTSGARSALRAAARPSAARTHGSLRGFTLIELLVAVSVAGVLSSVALPGFENQLQRARRSSVLVAMMQIQLAQERFRSNGTRYGSLGEIGVPAVAPAGHYNLQASASTAEGYDVLATAVGAQARDTACRFMRLSALGGNLVHGSGPDSTTANPAAANRKCWML